MNNDIKKYKTKSGKTRYQIRIYAGKYKANGQSNFIRKKGFKSLNEAENAYISIKHDLKKSIVNGLMFMPMELKKAH